MFVYGKSMFCHDMAHIMYASSKGSGETVDAEPFLFACHKYHFHMRWLKYIFEEGIINEVINKEGKSIFFSRKLFYLIGMP